MATPYCADTGVWTAIGPPSNLPMPAGSGGHLLTTDGASRAAWYYHSPSDPEGDGMAGDTWFLELVAESAEPARGASGVRVGIANEGDSSAPEGEQFYTRVNGILAYNTYRLTGLAPPPMGLALTLVVLSIDEWESEYINSNIYRVCWGPEGGATPSLAGVPVRRLTRFGRKG